MRSGVEDYIVAVAAWTSSFSISHFVVPLRSLPLCYHHGHLFIILTSALLSLFCFFSLILWPNGVHWRLYIAIWRI